LYGILVSKVSESIRHAGLEKKRNSRTMLPVNKTRNLEILVYENVSRIKVRVAKGRFEQILVFWVGGNEVPRYLQKLLKRPYLLRRVGLLIIGELSVLPEWEAWLSKIL